MQNIIFMDSTENRNIIFRVESRLKVFLDTRKSEVIW